MTKAEELRNRWRMLKERLGTLYKLSELISEKQVLEDVDFLQKRVDQLERDLADSLSRHSSKWGALTEIRDGALYYRIAGKFVPISEIEAAIKLVEKLRKVKAATKKLAKEQKIVFDEIQTALETPLDISNVEKSNENKNSNT